MWRVASYGVSRAVMSARMTTGKFEPLRLVHRHQANAVAPLLEDGGLGRPIGRGLRLQHLDEPAERHAAVELVLPRQLRDVQHVREGLFATRAQHEPDVRARSLEERRNGVSDRTSIAGAMK